MEAVCGSVLSTTLQVLFDRIAQNQEFLVGLFPGNKKLQLNRLIRVLRILSPVLEDAENKQERSPAVKAWFNSIRHAVYQVDDVLDEINTERLRINLQHSKGNFSDAENKQERCSTVKTWFNNTDFSDQFIGELSPTLEEICDALERKVQRIGMLGLRILYGNQKREDKRLSTSVVNKTEIFGRDDEKEEIIKMVLSCEAGTDISVIPITGMGGIGKTTLAQLVYNDERVKNLFQTRAWICISEEFDVYRATKDLLKEVNPSEVDDKGDLNCLQVKLKEKLEGKRFIIILDDIWNDNYNDCQHLMGPLNSGGRGSKIVVTTRNENIAVMLQNQPFHRLKPITDDQSWSLFKLHAFDNIPRSLLLEFETIGRRIMEKCKGLPLAIKTIVGTLRSTHDIREWRDISNNENWVVEGDILPALSLSYKLLPSHLKCCFDFCGVLPKDVPFTKEKVALLWMANDLVQPSTKKVAQNYFEELRSRSFFEEVVNKKYVMHDLVNDLARIVSGNFCARIEDYHLKNLQQGIKGGENNLPQGILHLSYMSSYYNTLERVGGLAQVQGLRTFLPIHQYDGDVVRGITTLFFSDILPKFRYVRALSLHGYHLYSVIPYSIGHLKHLRFLNLAKTKIEKLPNDIPKCLNLQTLILAGCSELKELPEDMRFLINLQHLDISGCWQLKQLPEDMRFLINLQHLNISDCSKLEKLPEDMRNLINLQHLHISGCWRLKKLPNDMRHLINLQHLDISGRWNCIRLSPLGQLTALKRLYIGGMKRIREVGEEFYGNSSICKPFQVLQELKISYMKEWTTWNMHSDNADFLSLKKFEIEYCPKLVGDIPFHLTSVRTLEMKIIDCPSISLYLQSCDLKRLHIKGCKHVEFLPDGICNSSLERLYISDCGISTETIPLFSFSKLQELSINSLKSPSMFKIPNGYHQSLTSLQKLQIWDCDNILSFPKGGLPAPNLKEFIVDNCSKVKSLPEQMHTQLSSLVYLEIRNCPEMECFPDGGLPPSLERLRIDDCKKLMMFSRNWGLQRLPSLINLEIVGIEDKLFPGEGLLPASLQLLDISECPNLEALDHKGLSYITSLKELFIYNCRELRYLPEEGLPSSLSKLYIDDCPKLAARIEREKGEDWPKVQSIPIIQVNGELTS